jgi:hypothetical protein
MQTQQQLGDLPNHLVGILQKLEAYLPVFGLLILSVHLFEGGMLLTWQVWFLGC